MSAPQHKLEANRESTAVKLSDYRVTVEYCITNRLEYLAKYLIHKPSIDDHTATFHREES